MKPSKLAMQPTEPRNNTFRVILEMPVSVECGPRRIKVSVLENYIESTLALSRTELRLRNIKCVATFNVTARAYEFFFDMSSCGSRVKVRMVECSKMGLYRVLCPNGFVTPLSE